MANVQKKNAIYVDATGSITVAASTPIILGVLICPSAAASRVTIKESASGTVIFDVKIERLESRYLDFSGCDGIQVGTTFEVATLTNITSVIIYGKFFKEG